MRRMNSGLEPVHRVPRSLTAIALATLCVAAVAVCDVAPASAQTAADEVTDADADAASADGTGEDSDAPDGAEDSDAPDGAEDSDAPDGAEDSDATRDGTGADSDAPDGAGEDSDADAADEVESATEGNAPDAVDPAAPDAAQRTTTDPPEPTTTRAISGQPTATAKPTILKAAGAAAPADTEAASDLRPPGPAPDLPANTILDIEDRFRFGSYGRAQVASDLRGSLGRQTRIVFPAPRIDESLYAELEFGYLAYRDSNGVEVDTVFIVAFGDDVFHFDGDFDSSIAIRNAYAEARNVFFDGSFVWVGSRMYRGDDVYLLDVWPLDNLNTYGGGFGWRGDQTRVAFHTGVNRLDDEYQFQVVDVVDERFVGEEEVVFMDRLRVISSLQATQLFGGKDGDPGYKVKVYGEVHNLPEGTLRREEPRTEEFLPSDFGWLAGLQLGTWNILNERSFVNLFFKFAGGLAAYGEMAIPFGVDTDKTASDAFAFTTALSANIETDWFGVLVGAHARYFLDADGQGEDYDDGWDAAWAIRPMAFIGEYFTPGFEISHQLRRPNGLSPVTLTQDTGQIWKFSVLPALTFGDGMYARPQLRLNYTVSLLNEGAQNMFPIDDPRRGRDVEHFFGAAVEWWFNSTSYGF